MSSLKDIAINRLNDLDQTGGMEHSDYSLLFDAICEIDSLQDRDEQLEALWEDFGNVPFDFSSETITEDFLNFPAGTPREDIWHWFDERHSKGIAYLLYQYQKGKCFVLCRNSYDRGKEYKVFFHDMASREAMQKDMESVLKSLEDEGYSPTVIRSPFHPQIRVHGTDIFYEWDNIPSNIYV